MLRELAEVRQDPGEPRRRWFADDYFDLIVWFGKPEEIIGFQLCYDKEGEEHALTWRRSMGFSHHRVEDGERHRPYKATPILISDGPVNYPNIAHLFEERSSKMDKKVARFVLGKLSEPPT